MVGFGGVWCVVGCLMCGSYVCVLVFWSVIVGDMGLEMVREVYVFPEGAVVVWDVGGGSYVLELVKHDVASHFDRSAVIVIVWDPY